MSRLLSAAAVLLALVQPGQQAPANIPQFSAGRLIGGDFGIPGLPQTFDYVVVGGGNAGLTIAARLAEDPSKTVAVIEAGSFYEIDNGNWSQVPAYGQFWSGKDRSDINPLVDWGFMTTPQTGVYDASIHYARGKTLGGSTARNYMTYQRGTEGSYKMWADMVGDQSYTWRNFLPFFQKSTNFAPPDMSKRAANSTPEYNAADTGTGGPVSVTFPNYAQALSSWVQRGFHELGFASIPGFNSGKLIGTSYVTATIDAKTMTRASSETAYLEPALDRNNLIVYHSTLAKRVLFDSNKRATGVVVDSGAGPYTLSARSEVILSAGAFQSPQLLMVSGVGPAATLQRHSIPVVADRPGVGQNMWDHVLMGISYRVNVITPSALGNPQFSAQAANMFNTDQSGILTSPGGDYLAWEKIPQSMRSSFSNSTLRDLDTFPSDWPEIEFLATAGYFGYAQNFLRDSPTDGYMYATVAVGLVAPLSRGTVDISSADTADHPIINPNFLVSPTDQAVAIAGYKRVRALFNTTALRPALIGGEYFPGANVSTDAQILDIIKKSFTTISHASSTCAMGRTNDPQAVVDSQARVIGVQGLRVVDASAMPILPPGHPMSTVYALAEKIADVMKRRELSGYGGPQ